jgi:hypothetical protein
MEFFSQPRDVGALHQEIDGVQKYITRLMAEKDVLIEDLKGYETPGYEYFKAHVLAKERVRIALLRMTVDADKVYLHDRLQGQFNEVELLGNNKETIERDIAVKTRQISEQLVKIEKLKKQLKNQAERKT